MSPPRARFGRARRAAAGVTLAGVALLCVSAWWGPEHAGVLGQAQYAPYPLLLAAAAAVALLAWGCGRAWRVASLAAVVLVATVLMGLRLNWPGGGAPTLRLMTFNAKGYLAASRPDWAFQLAHEVARHDPDVIVLQDARELGRVGAETLAAMFPGREVYRFGQYAIASRLPLRDCSSGSIPFRSEPHTFAQCVVDARGTEVEVVTAHFLTPRDGLTAIRGGELGRGLEAWRQNMEDRMEQARLLARRVAERKRPILVAGDFNATPWSLVVRELEDAGLRNAFSESGLGFGFTYGHSLRPGFSFLRLDHILASPEFRIVDCFVGDDGISTHRPVVADLSLAGGRS